MGLFGFMKSKSADDWYAEAMDYFENREYAKAANSFSHAAEMGNVEAQYRCGIAYDKLNKPEKAMEVYQAAAEKGNETAALIVDYRKNFAHAVSQLFDWGQLPHLRPLPADPLESGRF